MTNRTDELKVLEQIQSAFPRGKKDILTHEDCLRWRVDLPLLRYEDLPSILGQLLEDLIRTRSGEPYGTESLDMVLLFLDVEVVGTDLSVLGEDRVKKFAEDASYLRKEGEEMATTFTLSQAKAILAWLELTREWPDTKYYLKVIDSASNFWRKRVTEQT